MAWIPSLQSLALQQAPQSRGFFDAVNTTTLINNARQHKITQNNNYQNHRFRYHNRAERNEERFEESTAREAELIKALVALQNIYKTLQTPYIRQAMTDLEKDLKRQKEITRVTLSAHDLTGIAADIADVSEPTASFIPLYSKRLYDDVIIVKQPAQWKECARLLITCGSEYKYCAINLSSRQPDIKVHLDEHWSLASLPSSNDQYAVSESDAISFAIDKLTCRLKGLSRGDQPYKESYAPGWNTRLYPTDPQFWSTQPLITQIWRSSNNPTFDQCLQVMKIAITKLKLVRDAQKPSKGGKRPRGSS